jgi:hypothetical protein
MADPDISKPEIPFVQTLLDEHPFVKKIINYDELEKLAQKLTAMEDVAPLNPMLPGIYRDKKISYVSSKCPQG